MEKMIVWHGFVCPNCGACKTTLNYDGTLRRNDEAVFEYTHSLRHY